MSDHAPIDMYIGTYADRSAAQAAWDALKQLATDGHITVEGLVLVGRDMGGMIHVKDIVCDVGVGAEIGAVGGAVIAQIFPPALVASAVGAGLSAGAGGLLDYHLKCELKVDVEEELPPECTDIVTLFRERWVTEVENALGQADNISRHWVDAGSFNDVRGGATQAHAVQ